jgi:hypothetical protein
MNRFLRYTAAAILGAAGWIAMSHGRGPIAQADTNYSLSSPASKFIVRSLAVTNGFQVIRMDLTTGDACYPSAGKWLKYVDDAPPGPGVYDVQMMPAPDGKTVYLIRTDVSTGRVWYINGTKWIMFTDQ